MRNSEHTLNVSPAVSDESGHVSPAESDECDDVVSDKDSYDFAVLSALQDAKDSAYPVFCERATLLEHAKASNAFQGRRVIYVVGVSETSPADAPPSRGALVRLDSVHELVGRLIMVREDWASDNGTLACEGGVVVRLAGDSTLRTAEVDAIVPTMQGFCAVTLTCYAFRYFLPEVIEYVQRWNTRGR